MELATNRNAEQFSKRSAISEAASSSSLSSPPVTNNEGGSSQDFWVTDSTSDSEWPQLRGGRKARAKAAPKTKATKNTVKKKASEDIDEDDDDDQLEDEAEQLDEDEAGSKPAPARRNAKQKAEDPGEGSSANAPRKRVSLGKATQSKAWNAPSVLTYKTSPLGQIDRNDLMVCPPKNAQLLRLCDTR
jgi:hypothetical protein